eukprot:6175987-Pleurochrysis_carterae.AAC.1
MRRKVGVGVGVGVGNSLRITHPVRFRVGVRSELRLGMGKGLLNLGLASGQASVYAALPTSRVLLLKHGAWLWR